MEESELDAENSVLEHILKIYNFPFASIHSSQN